jgi:hypothetical protein
MVSEDQVRELLQSGPGIPSIAHSPGRQLYRVRPRRGIPVPIPLGPYEVALLSTQIYTIKPGQKQGRALLSPRQDLGCLLNIEVMLTM